MQPADSSQASVSPSGTSLQAISVAAATETDTARTAQTDVTSSAAHVDVASPLSQAAALSAAVPSSHGSISVSEATATEAADTNSNPPPSPFNTTAEKQLHVAAPQTMNITDGGGIPAVVAAGHALPPAVAALVLEHQLHLQVVLVGPACGARSHSVWEL